MRRDVFQAIADPTRREIISLLASERLTLTQVAENFSISRPAISKHIKILRESGLVTVNKLGRERYCIVNPQKLIEVGKWIKYFDKFWDMKLNSLKNYLEENDEE